MFPKGGSNLPDLSGVVFSWAVPLSFSKVTQTVILTGDNRGEILETSKLYKFEGVWQPLSPKTINLKPVEVRAFSWFLLHCPISIDFNINDIVRFEGKNYKVMSKFDWHLNKYIEYHLVLDYE